MTNYEKIRQACVKVNPKLMELKFGCYIIHKPIYSDTKKKAIVNKIYSGSTRYITGTEFVGECVLEDDDSTTAFCKENVVEILGYEPAWSDLLLALGDKFRVSGDGKLEQWDTQDWWDEGYVDLTKPLKEQSEEVLKFIANFIKYKEGQIVDCEQVVTGQLWEQFDLEVVESNDKAYCGVSNGEEWYKDLKNNVGEIYIEVNTYDDYFAQLMTKEVKGWYATFDATLANKSTKFKLINKSK
jgi:hypothetical protein